MVFWPILVLTHFAFIPWRHKSLIAAFSCPVLHITTFFLVSSVSLKVICQSIPLPCLGSAVYMQTTPNINFHYFCYCGHWRGPLATASLPADPFLSSSQINEGACLFSDVTRINTRYVYVWKVNLFQRFCIIFTCMTYAIRFTDTVPLISLKHILFQMNIYKNSLMLHLTESRKFTRDH